MERKASRMHFWQGTGKWKDGTLKYQNENINKLGRKRKLSLLEVFFPRRLRRKLNVHKMFRRHPGRLM